MFKNKTKQKTLVGRQQDLRHQDPGKEAHRGTWMLLFFLEEFVEYNMGVKKRRKQKLERTKI